MKPLLATLGACVAAMPLCAQTPARVDFQRDVQPIFEQHCYGCHGPDQQMNGLRLDRRGDAMRGGTQSNIGPGNADGSRLFHRVAGTSLGTRMPPGRPLTDEQVTVIHQWIEEGAEWPDAASGEKPVPPVDSHAARFASVVRTGDRAAIDALLRSNGVAAGAHGPAGATPLMMAALYGDAALVRRLLDAGADPNSTNNSGATALMWAAPDVAKMRLLLDAGANVDARSDDRRTSLLITSGIVGAAPALRQLLEYGADAWAGSIEISPLRESARAGDAEIFRTLMEYGASVKSAGVSPPFLRTVCFACAQLAGVADGGLEKMPPTSEASATAPRYDPGRAARPTEIGVMPVTLAAVRAAVDRSLPLLQDVGVSFMQQTGCVSCHHNSLVSLAVAAARENGVAVNDAVATGQSTAIGAYLEGWRERTIQNIPIAGGVDTISYLLFGLAADRYAPDAATDAQAIWLKRHQAPDGRWAVNTIRPPIESNDIAATALSLRALQVFAPQAGRELYREAIDRARVWLTTARAVTSEERAFRLLGVSWSQAPDATVRAAADALLALQREDGGWSQLDAMGSDAYATGEALYALRLTGAVGKDNRAYRRGLAFLLRTQIDDGSWVVETRAVPIQAYFESGFPYGVNQWISAAATAWATAALALATR